MNIPRKEAIAYSPGQFDTHNAGRYQGQYAKLSMFLLKLGVIKASLVIPAAIFTVPISGYYQVHEMSVSGNTTYRNLKTVAASAGDVIDLNGDTVHVVRLS